MMQNYTRKDIKRIEGVSVKICQTDSPLYDEFNEFCRRKGSNPTNEIKKYITAMLSCKTTIPDLEKTDHSKDKFIIDLFASLKEMAMKHTDAIIELNKKIQEKDSENTQLHYENAQLHNAISDRDRLLGYIYSIQTPDQLLKIRRHEDERLLASTGYPPEPSTASHFEHPIIKDIPSLRQTGVNNP